MEPPVPNEVGTEALSNKHEGEKKKGKADEKEDSEMGRGVAGGKRKRLSVDFALQFYRLRLRFTHSWGRNRRRLVVWFKPSVVQRKGM